MHNTHLSLFNIHDCQHSNCQLWCVSCNLGVAFFIRATSFREGLGPSLMLTTLGSDSVLPKGVLIFVSVSTEDQAHSTSRSAGYANEGTSLRHPKEETPTHWSETLLVAARL